MNQTRTTTSVPNEVDIVVIGMGPAGEHVAGRLAEAGLSVVGIEAELVGGECPYWGCVPSKMMIRAANLLAEARRIDGIAGHATVVPDWAPVAARIRSEATDDWDDGVAVDRFESKGGFFVRGHGRIIGNRRVQVGDRTFTARRGVVVATGTTASIPPIPGLHGTPYWTNREAIAAASVPESLIVLGGGAIGVELAQVFSRFGARVAIVEAQPQLLPLEEPESGALLADVFTSEGIAVRVGRSAATIEHTGATFEVTLSDGSSLQADRLLVATGRRVNLANLGLDAVGLDPDARVLAVDGRLRVADGVWAVGDITGQGMFTHMAMYQANIAVADILGQEHSPTEAHAVPRVTFTDPEIGSVGLTEVEARQLGRDVLTAVVDVRSTARGWLHKVGNEGLIKVVVEGSEGVVIGATSAGPVGGEVLGLLTLAVHARIPLNTLRSMIYAYPTFHRGVQDALDALPI